MEARPPGHELRALAREAGEMPAPPEAAWRECRLVRADGSRWVVTRFDADCRPPRVEALPASALEPAPGVSGKGVRPDDPPEPTRIPLRPDDRIEWIGEGGEVLWRFGSARGA